MRTVFVNSNICKHYRFNTRKQLSENSRPLSRHKWFRSWLRWYSLLIQTMRRKLQLSCCLVQEPEGNQRKYQRWRIDRGSVLRKVSWGSVGKLIDNVHLASTIELRNLDLIIITEICKAPTPRLKPLNKHSITHNVHPDEFFFIGNLTKT